MKKILTRGLATAAALCLLLTACQQETPQPESDVVEASQFFRSVYRFPTGKLRATVSESDLLDQNQVNTENEQVVPTLARILEDIMAGRLVPTPIDPLRILPEEQYTDGYALKMIEKVSKTEGYTQQSLLMGFEVDYSAEVNRTGTNWKAAWFRIVYIDPNEIYPDKNMFQLSRDQIADYRMGQNNDGQALVNFLDQRKLEGYPIMVESTLDTIRFRTLEEAFHYHALMEAGETDQLFREPIL